MAARERLDRAERTRGRAWRRWQQVVAVALERQRGIVGIEAADGAVAAWRRVRSTAARCAALAIPDVDWEAEIARAERRIAALRPTRSQRRRQQREERKAAREREAQELRI